MQGVSEQSGARCRGNKNIYHFRKFVMARILQGPRGVEGFKGDMGPVGPKVTYFQIYRCLRIIH